MESTKLEKKMSQLEKIQKEIKDEQRRIEQNIGKLFMKTFDLTHEDFNDAKELINKISEANKQSSTEMNKTQDNESYNDVN